MKKFAVGLLLLVVLAALVVELLAPQLAASRIEEHVRTQTSGVAGVSADVGTFPVVTRLLATERVPRVSVTLEEVAGQRLTIAQVRVDLEGVQLDRDALLAGDVRVRGMRSGRATALIDLSALSDALGVAVRTEAGTLVVDLGRTVLEVPLSIEDGALRLPGGLPAIALPDVLPCGTTQTDLGENVIELSCSLDEVPFFLR